MMRSALGPRLVVALLAAQTPVPLAAQPSTASSAQPTAALRRAPVVRLPGRVDSNSPALWTVEDGAPVLRVLTSIDGQPWIAVGPSVYGFDDPVPVQFLSHPGYGVWMEAVIEDVQGVWYAYYHNEVPAEFCGRPNRAVPRIGAARSLDKGTTWEDLGIVLEAPAGTHDCATPNAYLVGGVGDLSALLDTEGAFVYFFFSQYGKAPAAQGVGVARLMWAARDRPMGRIEVWNDGAWLPPRIVAPDASGEGPRWHYESGTALFPTTRPWHDADPVNDAFWGASVHWNAYLGQYVMLLNRAADEQFGQEGIYVSYASRLDDAAGWSMPVRLLEGGSWYPQVIGFPLDRGTDKHAGRWARFFMSGTSRYFIEFTRP